MALRDLVVEKIKQYRQGVRTVHELHRELKDERDLQPLSDSSDLLHEMMSKVGLGAFNCNELNGIPEASATRAGVIHHLEEYLSGGVTINEIGDWAETQITWEVGRPIEDPTVSLITENILAQFDVEPDKNFTNDIILQLLRVLRSNADPYKEQIAVQLAFPHVMKSFCHYTLQFRQGAHSPEEYEKYISDKFWLPQSSFPYWDEVKQIEPDLQAISELAGRMLLNAT